MAIHHICNIGERDYLRLLAWLGNNIRHCQLHPQRFGRISRACRT